MAEDWVGIAGEIAGAIADVGFTATLIKPPSATGPEYAPTYGTPTEISITVLQDIQMAGDRPQALELLGKRTLVIATGAGVSIGQGDKIKIGSEQPQDIAPEGVRALAPGGVTLLWEVDLVG